MLHYRLDYHPRGFLFYRWSLQEAFHQVLKTYGFHVVHVKNVSTHGIWYGTAIRKWLAGSSLVADLTEHTYDIHIQKELHQFILVWWG
jgi:hypothetical protein